MCVNAEEKLATPHFFPGVRDYSRHAQTQAQGRCVRHYEAVVLPWMGRGDGLRSLKWSLADLIEWINTFSLDDIYTLSGSPSMLPAVLPEDPLVLRKNFTLPPNLPLLPTKSGDNTIL